MLVDNKDRRYLVTLKAGGQFHSHKGFIEHDEMLALPEGSRVRSTGGTYYRIIRPTLSDFVLKMPRGAQVIYPKDLGPDPDAGRHPARAPGARVRDRLGRAVHDAAAGRRRSCTATSSATTSPSGPRRTSSSFLGDEAMSRYHVEVRNSYEGIDETDLDRIVLDLPEPWQVVKHAVHALRPGGILVAYTPSIIQASQLREALVDTPFAMAETLEVLLRTWHVEGAAVRPDHRMVAHTGFLTHARLLTD